MKCPPVLGIMPGALYRLCFHSFNNRRLLTTNNQRSKGGGYLGKDTEPGRDRTLAFSSTPDGLLPGEELAPMPQESWELYWLAST